ncbi:hypothetical protein F5X68DRAFT_11968 [Plectosphaerella plurivora]|uniref:Uncharacterized protein n=1 Tax=Plectosphaerella plurivora TaxID=936078 RepID=A0A9P8VCJ4_9PEZI|nr:hypothetical protein F5X68DRAFT_11968 [Plectosphaerella plurivora]
MKAVSTQCKTSIENVIPVFTVTMGKASVEIPNSVWETLGQTSDKLAKSYNLNDPESIMSSRNTLQRILAATFDRDELAFLTQHSQALDLLDDSLDGITRAHELAQAIAGMVTILEKVAAIGRQVDASLVNDEIRHFAESEHRRRIAQTIEGSRVFARCYDRSQITDLILRAVEDKEDSQWESLADDEQAAIGWASELPSRNMGLPWGFSILALN